MSVQIATRVDEQTAERFRDVTRRLGTTPADALRMFIASFNARGGFPYEVRLAEPEVEAFSSEEEATDFAEHLAFEMMHDAR